MNTVGFVTGQAVGDIISKSDCVDAAPMISGWAMLGWFGALLGVGALFLAAMAVAADRGWW